MMATEFPLYSPLDIDIVYWPQFVLQQGAAPSIADFYTEICTMLWMGLEESAAIHGVIIQAKTLEIWLDMLLHLFDASNTCHALPGPGKIPS